MDLDQRARNIVSRETVATPADLDIDRAITAEEDAKSSSPLRDSFKRFARDKRAIISLVILATLFFGSFILLPIYEHIGVREAFRHGFFVYGPDTYHAPGFIDSDHTHMPAFSSGLHWLGTDDQGRDILARILTSIQVSVLVSGVVIGIVDVFVGSFLGVVAGFFGGWIDFVLDGFTNLIFAFPGLLFAIVLAAAFATQAEIKFGPTGRLYLVILALGVTIWPFMARYVRGQTLQLKQQQYVEAARTVGTSSAKIILRHILPNILSLIIVAASLDMAGAIVSEGALSYLGLGVQSPGASLGKMISDSSSYLPYYPYEEMVPVLTLVIIILTLSFISDGLRDAFDPRSKD
jgi:oligopeptide transport system permease protein